MSRPIVISPEKTGAGSMKRGLSMNGESPEKKKTDRKGVSTSTDLSGWQRAQLNARNPSWVGGAWTELWGSFLFKLVLYTVVLASIELECGDEPAPMPKTWWGGKGSPAVAVCEPQYTFPVVLATVFLLIVWLAFGTGAHLNPSITVGAVAAGMLPLAHGLVRVAAQVGGVALAMTALREGAPARLHKFVAPSIPLDPSWAFALEAGFTFFNVMVGFFSGVWGRYRASVTAAIIVLEIVASGASMDPSGAFAASFFQQDWRHHLEIYWGASLLGAVLAGLVWRALHRAAKATKTKAE